MMKMIVVNQQLQYVYCPISQEVKVTINFDQLIEYGMPKNFLKNSNMKCGGKTITKPSSRKTRLKCLWINSLKFHIVCFYCMPRWGLPTTCFNLIEIFLKKTIRDLKLVSLPHFLHHFIRKIFVNLYSADWPNLIFW